MLKEVREHSGTKSLLEAGGQPPGCEHQRRWLRNQEYPDYYKSQLAFIFQLYYKPKVLIMSSWKDE